MSKKMLPIWVLLLIAVFAVGANAGTAYAQEMQAASGESAPSEVSVEQPAPLARDLAPEQAIASTAVQPQETEKGKEGNENNVTLDFKDADIQNILRVLAYKSGVNIIAGKEVVGTVTIRLVDVPWEQALQVILSTYGFAYEREGNIISVSTVDALKERREKKKELTEIEGVTSKVFTLQFLDAADAKKMLEPQLSPQGKISVLEITGQKGWKIGAAVAGGTSSEEGKERRARENSRSRLLVITDTPTFLDRITKILKDIDVKPVQVLIEARIMEVDKNVLRDLGVEWSTGSRLQTHAAKVDAGGTLLGGIPVSLGGKRTGTPVNAESVVTGSNYSSTEPGSLTPFTPSNFVPLATGLTPSNVGLQLLFQKLWGTQMEAMIHALEEDVRTNTLSAPKILTLSGQEALILIGQKYPIVESNISGTSGTATITLAYYQDVGIQLYVVPQVSGDEKYINMIVHPVVSSYTNTVTANAYPILLTREAETQILMSDGETVVIGGLLRDVKSKGRVGIPVLGDIPIIGNLFSRATNNVTKIDLLIFITARVIRPGELTEQEMAMIKQAIDAGQANVIPVPEPEKKDNKKEDKKKEKPDTATPAPAEGFSKGNMGYIKK